MSLPHKVPHCHQGKVASSRVPFLSINVVLRLFEIVDYLKGCILYSFH